MKTMALVGLFLVSASAAMATEFKNNPDRFPSIGINYTGTSEDGELTTTASGLSAKQDGRSSTGLLAVDARVPISQSVTVNGVIGFTRVTTEADETLLLTGGESEADGYMLGVGIRFYFNQDAASHLSPAEALDKEYLNYMRSIQQANTEREKLGAPKEELLPFDEWAKRRKGNGWIEK